MTRFHAFKLRFLWLLLAGLAASCPLAAEIIPATNAPVTVWAVAGVPGGIPTRTTIYTTLNPGATAAQIETAINACPSNQVVKLSAGTFTLTDNIDIGQVDHWTLRGAGMGRTIIVFDTSNSAGLEIGDGPSWTSTVDISAGGTQGSTNITVSSTSGYAVGSFGAIDQRDTGWIVNFGTGGLTSPTVNSNQLGKGGISGNTNVQVHYVRITAVSGSTLTFWPPLPYTLTAARIPQISRSTTRGPYLAGLEDMTLDFSDYTGTYPTRFQGVSSFWLKNCEVKGWDNNFGFWMRKNASVEIRGCYIHNPRAYAKNRGYGLLLDGVAGSLITDNIIYQCESTMLLQNGCTGNVLAYNVFAFGKFVNSEWDGEWLQHEMSGNHTPFPCYNLFEGNYTGQFQSDYYYGPSGWGTLFRNRIPGNSSATEDTNPERRFTVSIDAQQRYYSVVGNQLGERAAPNSVYLALPGVTRTYAEPGTITWGYDPGSAVFTSPYIYRLGYPSSGNNSSSSGLRVHDAFVKSNTLRHGNWDAANNGVIWDAAIADHAIPDSLFLSGKPDWFGSLAWPPYGTNAPTGITNELSSIPAGYRLLFNYGLMIAPQNLRVGNGQTVQFYATNSLGNGVFTNVTESAFWTSSIPNAVSINRTSGLAQALTEFEFQLTISATWSNLTASTGVIITNSPGNYPPTILDIIFQEVPGEINIGYAAWNTTEPCTNIVDIRLCNGPPVNRCLTTEIHSFTNAAVGSYSSNRLELCVQMFSGGVPRIWCEFRARAIGLSGNQTTGDWNTICSSGVGGDCSGRSAITNRLTYYWISTNAPRPIEVGGGMLIAN